MTKDDYNKSESQHPWAKNFSYSIDEQVREELQEAARAVRLAKKVEYKTPGIFCEGLKDSYNILETNTKQ